MQYDRQEQKWTLDRHVPIMVLIAIALQTMAWIWWAATFAARTDARIEALELQAQQVSKLPERMTAVETQIQYTNSLLRDIRDEMRARGAGYSPHK